MTPIERNSEFYKKIRAQRKTPAKGTFQLLSKKERSAMGKKAAAARWGKTEQTNKEDK